MATKASETAEKTEPREENVDGPLMDSNSAAVRKMMAKAKERGFVTYDELNAVLPSDQMSSEQIEDTMATSRTTSMRWAQTIWTSRLYCTAMVWGC